MFSLILTSQGLAYIVYSSTLVIFRRVLDLENDENYVLSLDSHSGFQSNECISCLAYSQEKGECIRIIFCNEIDHAFVYRYFSNRYKRFYKKPLHKIPLHVEGQQF